MISKHCGQRLKHVAGQYCTGGVHVWRCQVCQKMFRQQQRVAKSKTCGEMGMG